MMTATEDQQSKNEKLTITFNDILKWFGIAVAGVGAIVLGWSLSGGSVGPAIAGASIMALVLALCFAMVLHLTGAWSGHKIQPTRWSYLTWVVPGVCLVSAIAGYYTVYVWAPMVSVLLTSLIAIVVFTWLGNIADPRELFVSVDGQFPPDDKYRADSESLLKTPANGANSSVQKKEGDFAEGDNVVGLVVPDGKFDGSEDETELPTAEL